MRTKPSPISVVLTTLLVTGAIIATPATAEARQYVHQDARGDMFEVSTSPYAPHPEQTNGDILRVRVRHMAHRIRVRVVLAELAQAPNTQIQLDVPFWTNEGVFRSVQIIAVPGDWRGSGAMFTQRGYYAHCEVRFAFDYAHNVMAFNFNRTCLSNPRWIRVEIQTSTSVPEGGMGWPPIVQDDAMRTGVEQVSPRSPRIRRR